jgi:protein-disulfide isomerase/uncharacterized membrane protein
MISNRNEKSTLPLLGILVVALIGLVLAVLSLLHYSEFAHGIATSGESYCNISATMNCDAVNRSSWSVVAGLPVASHGILFYMVIIGVSALGIFSTGTPRGEINSAILFITAVGVVASLALFLISQFAIGALCPLCLATYATNGLLLLLAWRTEPDVSFLARLRTGLVAILTFPRRIFAPVSNSGWIAAILLAIFLGGALVLTYQSPQLSLRYLKDQEAPATASNPTKNTKERAITLAIESWKRAQPITPAVDAGVSDDYRKGPADAPIKIVEFSDFECPHCRRLSGELVMLAERYPGKVQLVFRNFPIDNSCNPLIPSAGHQGACHAALFAVCAGEQGRFWDTADYLFNLPELELRPNRQQAQEVINNSVLRLSLDADGMQECLRSSRPTKVVSTDIQAANRAGLKGTPFIVINDRPVSSPLPEVLAGILREIIGE